MFTHLNQTKLGREIDELNLDNQYLLNQLWAVINQNFSLPEADSLEDMVTASHVNMLHYQHVYPSNPLVRQAFSILLTHEENNFSKLIFSSEKNIYSMLNKEAI